MSKSILVVDDERDLAETLAAILKHAGYQAMSAFSAEEAQEFLLTNKIDLLISDVVMPGLNGFELAAFTRERYPDVHILLISGNAATQEIAATSEIQRHRFELLAKPIPPQQMLEQIELMLASRPGPQSQ